MDEFQSEKEQIEEIKKWWKQNGGFIITGMILGIGVLGGWKYWNDFKEGRASAASAQYEQLTQAIARNDRNGATDLLNSVSTDFGATPYPSQAALAMAKFYVKSDEPELAATQLRFVLDNSKDDYLRLVARHRLARIQLSQNRADEALATLEVVNPGSFAARIHEVRGDAYAALGRMDDARSEYQSALDNFEPGLIDQQMVEMKLNNLTVVYSEPSSGTATDTAVDSVSGSATDTATDTSPEIEPGA